MYENYGKEEEKMKYTVKLNQKVYEVEIERAGGHATSEAASISATPPATSVEAAAPSFAKPTAAPAPSSGGAGIQVECPMPGKVLSIAASVGQTVRAGECLLVIEAMKMENEIVAPQGGTVKQILVSQGTAVDTGDVLAVLI